MQSTAWHRVLLTMGGAYALCPTPEQYHSFFIVLHLPNEAAKA